MLNNESLLIRLLSGVSVFAGFSQHNAKDLLAYATRIDVDPGTYVVRELDSGREFYIVLSGQFSVTKTLPSGKEKIIAQLQPGDTFGEMSFLDGRPRAASVFAESSGLLLKFDRNGLMKIPDTAAKIYFNLASLMAGRIRNTNMLISLALEERENAAASGVPVDALKTHRNFKNK